MFLYFYFFQVSRPESVEVSLQQTGSELKKQVAELCGVSDDRIKLIVSGQLIQDENSLMSSNIKVSNVRE